MRTFHGGHRIGNPTGMVARGRQAIALLLVLAVLHLGVIPAAWAEGRADGATESTGTQYGLGTASVFLNLLYGPVKFVFASLGGIFGGFTYAFSAGNETAAKAVWDTSMRGTYVLTPDHLKGDKAVRFFGMPAEDSAPAAQEPLPVEPAPAAPAP